MLPTESSRRWEVGSFFAWDALALSPLPSESTSSIKTSPWPSSQLFSTGVGALTALLEQLDARRSRRSRVHLPTFFCMTTASDISRSAPVEWYRELPDGRGPDGDSIHAVPGDVVLAVNLFARGRPEAWASWRAAHPDVVVVEDHTHDPLSEWARSSTADYCLSSLRKTLPVPDGAVLWSPTGRDTVPPRSQDHQGACLKWAGMVLKAAWLQGRDVDVDAARALAADGEALLATPSPAAASPVTRLLVPGLDVQRMRAARERNVTTLTRALGGPEPTGAVPWTLLRHSRPGSVPFHVQLLCEDGDRRDDLQDHLARHRVFAPVHWRQPTAGLSSGDPAAQALADRILTLPCDHRYGADDMLRVAETVHAWRPPVAVRADPCTAPSRSDATATAPAAKSHASRAS